MMTAKVTFPFLPERINVSKSQKLVCNMFCKKNYVVYIKALKLAFDNRLILEKQSYMGIGMTTENQSMEARQNYAIRIGTVL